MSEVREGNDSLAPSEEDLELARRRFKEYIRLTKEMEPGSYDILPVIRTLPMDGGTILDCGETRFHHLINETCTDGPYGAMEERCSKEMRDGRLCFRKIGHSKQCMSKTYLQAHSRKQKEKRRQVREGKMEGRERKA